MKNISMLNLSIIWIRPSGLYIKQKNVEFTKYHIINNVLSIMFYQKEKQLVLEKPRLRYKKKIRIRVNSKLYTFNGGASKIFLLYEG